MQKLTGSRISTNQLRTCKLACPTPETWWNRLCKDLSKLLAMQKKINKKLMMNSQAKWNWNVSAC